MSIENKRVRVICGEKALSRLTVSILLTAFVLPLLGFGNGTKVLAESRSGSIPTSAPPEPFLVHPSSPTLDLMASAAATFESQLYTRLLPPAIPAEFGIAKPETLLQQLTSGISSVLSLVQPVVEARGGSAALPTAVGPVKFDFNNDGKADVGRWHSGNFEMKVAYSGSTSTGTYTVGSSSSAKAAPGDFNGDGATDAAVFNAGTWTYKTSPTASPVTISLGASGDTAMAGDYDGDGITDAAVYKPTTGAWTVRKSSTGTNDNYTFGTSGDIPTNGDFDGDGKADSAVYRPTVDPLTGACYWYIRKSSDGATLSIPWGSAADIPVQGDFDGDGKSDPTVYRPSTGTWYAAESSQGYTKWIQQGWGSYGDEPTPADYDGDGLTDFSVWRPTTGVWFTIKSSDGTYVYQTLGVPGDTAVPSAYTRQVGGTITGYDMATARLSPLNSTGGTNLYSQNFSWSAPLVGLPGRAGLDAGLGISYNSLVWIKNNNVMYFDPDTSNVSPGFHFGFPTIEPAYYDSVKSKWEYLVVGTDGGRSEFRQVGASNVYETADSTYSQLITNGA